MTQEKKIKKAKTTKKVQALVSLPRVGYAYFEGDKFEIDSKIADEWLDLGLVKEVK